jgi:hypothetical protein
VLKLANNGPTSQTRENGRGEGHKKQVILPSDPSAERWEAEASLSAVQRWVLDHGQQLLQGCIADQLSSQNLCLQESKGRSAAHILSLTENLSESLLRTLDTRERDREREREREIMGAK